MLTYFYNFLSVISSVHGVGSEGAKHCTCGLGILLPSPPHQTNVDPESCPRIPCKTIFLCEIPAWKNTQLYKSLAVVICDLLNFPAIMPRPCRWRSLIWRHLRLSLREAGLEGEPKLSLFSIVVSHHPRSRSVFISRRFFFSLSSLFCFLLKTEFCEHSSEASTQERAVNIPPAVSISYARKYRVCEQASEGGSEL